MGGLDRGEKSFPGKLHFPVLFEINCHQKQNKLKRGQKKLWQGTE